jgi:hypothetical protein
VDGCVVGRVIGLLGAIAVLVLVVGLVYARGSCSWSWLGTGVFIFWTARPRERGLESSGAGEG